MNLQRLLELTCAALAVARATAQISLQSFPDLVSVGETYLLNWTAQGNYSYNIWLIHDESKYDDNEYDWTKVQGLAAGLVYQNTLEPSFSWTVPSNLSVNDTYALWVNAGEIPFHGGTVSLMTDWFRVTTERVPSSTASATATATGGQSHPTNADSDQDSSGHHKGISGGAIAGIVIGVVLALGLVVGGLLLLRRRRGRFTVEDREAEARARRLEPVMQEGYPEGYELNKRMSKGAATAHTT